MLHGMREGPNLRKPICYIKIYTPFERLTLGLFATKCIISFLNMFSAFYTPVQSIYNMMGAVVRMLGVDIQGLCKRTQRF